MSPTENLPQRDEREKHHEWNGLKEAAPIEMEAKSKRLSGSLRLWKDPLYLIVSATYVGFAFAIDTWTLPILTCLAGLYIGTVATVALLLYYFENKKSDTENSAEPRPDPSGQRET